MSVGGAVALIQPLAWELPYAKGSALKRQKTKKKKKGRYELRHSDPRAHPNNHYTPLSDTITFQSIEG